MSRYNEFVAYKALVSLLKKRNLEHKITEVYEACKEEIKLTGSKPRNVVKDLYGLVSDEDLVEEIKLSITPSDLNATVDLIFQSVENLHKACPDHVGDWYFTGNYPTPGGVRVALRSFIYAYEGNNDRAY
jgi:amidophosphoribosyltransferase